MGCATSPPPAITLQEAELAAAQQEVTELERRLFGSPGPGTPEASQERQLVLLDALFAMEAPSEEGGSSEEGSAHPVSWLATAGRHALHFSYHALGPRLAAPRHACCPLLRLLASTTPEFPRL